MGYLTSCSNDLDPVPPYQRLWGPWNFVAFWLADSININTWMIGEIYILEPKPDLSILEYSCRTFLVGMLALCMGWLFHHFLLRCRLRSDGRRIPHFVPCHQSCIFRHLGIAMASLQSGCDGLHLVRSPILDWRGMRVSDASLHCA